MNHLAQTSTFISDAFPERDVSDAPYLHLTYPKYMQEPQRTVITERRLMTRVSGFFSFSLTGVFHGA